MLRSIMTNPFKKSVEKNIGAEHEEQSLHSKDQREVARTA